MEVLPRVRVLLNPPNVELACIYRECPILFGMVRSMQIEFDGMRWDGTGDSLPQHPPALVRIPPSLTRDEYNLRPIIAVCERLGHLCLHGDTIPSTSGVIIGRRYTDAVQLFLEDHIERHSRAVTE